MPTRRPTISGMSSRGTSRMRFWSVSARSRSAGAGSVWPLKLVMMPLLEVWGSLREPAHETVDETAVSRTDHCGSGQVHAVSTADFRCAVGTTADDWCQPMPERRADLVRCRMEL